jgi:4'-phosphopantetheinyl transferase
MISLQGITVYAVKVDPLLEERTYRTLLGYVSPEKKERIERFFRYEDALRTLLGDILTRYLISQSLGLKNQQLLFSKNEYGKPFLVNAGRLHFNISHSAEWVVCALGEAPVGIDVEKLSPVDDDLARKIFTAPEYRTLSGKSPMERLPYFYALWTLKESYIKALGKGLSIPLTSFSVLCNPGGRMVVQGVADWYFKQYDWGETYQLAVCAATDDFVDPVKVITHEECLAGLTRATSAIA